MNDDKLQLKQQPKIRNLLRYLGLSLLAIGILLTLIGMISFFGSLNSSFDKDFGSVQPPHYFWCAFLGLPLTFLGTVLTFAGFIGAFSRYFAGESAPVTKDVVNYMGENTQPGVKAFTKAITEGIKEGLEDSKNSNE
jgi:uncharacterized membrane protein